MCDTEKYNTQLPTKRKNYVRRKIRRNAKKHRRELRFFGRHLDKGKKTRAVMRITSNKNRRTFRGEKNTGK